MKYRAVAREELVKILGNQCSPDWRREGYLIGPDVNGRLCHIGSYFSIYDAMRAANTLNNKHSDVDDPEVQKQATEIVDDFLKRFG